jgi:hypothetical protein
MRTGRELLQESWAAQSNIARRNNMLHPGKLAIFRLLSKEPRVRFGATLEEMQHAPEPWLRGPIPGVDPLIAPILYAFEQAREDIAQHTEGLTTGQLWETPFGFGSVGFHIRHSGRSADRLITYLEGRPLSAPQLVALDTEKDPGASREDLLAELEDAFRRVEQVVRGIDPQTLREPRGVGRKQLPTTVVGLLTHIAEHTQRHVGQAISAAKLVRALMDQFGSGAATGGGESPSGGSIQLGKPA